MTTAARLCLAAALALLGVARASAAPTAWPTHDGAFDIPNFRFKDGGTLPVLHLHYLTLGSPHRDAAGHVDNAVLLLHGTGGDAHSLLNPAFSDVLFGPGQPLDITKYLPDPPRRHRPRPEQQAV